MVAHTRYNKCVIERNERALAFSTVSTERRRVRGASELGPEPINGLRERLGKSLRHIIEERGIGVEPRQNRAF